jgi:hypothetical protein
MANAQLQSPSRKRSFWIWLCWIGAHRMYGAWCEDGKGNSGSHLECERCGLIEEDYL